MESKARKQRQLYDQLFAKYEHTELNFPVCFKTKQGQIFRYHSDGKYEMLEKTEKDITCLLFGKIKYDWHDEEMHWIRMIISRTQVVMISEGEFIQEFENLIGKGYEKFLENEDLEKNDSEIKATESPDESHDFRIESDPENVPF